MTTVVLALKPSSGYLRRASCNHLSSQCLPGHHIPCYTYNVLLPAVFDCIQLLHLIPPTRESTMPVSQIGHDSATSARKGSSVSDTVLPDTRSQVANGSLSHRNTHRSNRHIPASYYDGDTLKGTFFPLPLTTGPLQIGNSCVERDLANASFVLVPDELGTHCFQPMLPFTTSNGRPLASLWKWGHEMRGRK